MSDELKRYDFACPWDGGGTPDEIEAPDGAYVRYADVAALLASTPAVSAEPVKNGCHVDLEPGQEPDGCVIDANRRNDCVYARRIKCKEECTYWQPIVLATTPASEQARDAAVRNAALDEAALECTINNAQTLRLHAGELTGNEILAVRAVLGFVERRIIAMKSGQADAGKGEEGC